MKKSYISNLVLGILLISFSNLYAQNEVEVTGAVTEAGNNQSLIGVNVQVKGTTIGASTNANGEYKLTAPSLQDTLVFSFIGYQTQEEPINGRTNIDVALQSATLSGEEVVVTGYTTQREEDVTGSVSLISSEDINEMSSGGLVSESLQGLASGVNVITSGQPGESPTVRVRGINTFGNNEPLYIVDGVPTESIEYLNPNNVASMQVLKDASAASIYGSRASNGVVVITTKGGSSGALDASYSGNFGVQLPASGNPFDILNPQEMAELRWQAIRNSGGTPGSDIYGRGSSPVLPDYLIAGNNVGVSADEVDLSQYNVNPNYTDPSQLEQMYRIIPANKQGTNWFQEIFDPALTTDHNISLSGGGDQSQFALSVNYRNQEGILKQTHLDRYNIRANSQFEIGDYIRIGENLTYTVQDNRLMDASDTEDSPVAFAYQMQPIIPVYDVGGNFGGGFGTPFFGANPVRLLDETKHNENSTNRLFGNVFAEVDLLKNLTLRTNFGGELSSSFSNNFNYPEVNNSENSTINRYIENSSSILNFSWTNQFTYSQTLTEKHEIEVVGGTEFNKNTFTERGGTAEGYFSFDPNYRFLSTGSGTKTNYSGEDVYTLFSLYGKVNYSFDGKYLVSATVRRDGSSKFLNNTYGIFPAASIGWRISQENFMQNITWLDDLKIRASYGIMGNQLNVTTSNSYTIYGGNQSFSYYDITGSNSNITEGFAQQQIGNPNARWEETRNFNIGLDGAFFNNKLDIAIDLYRKNIVDLLYNPAIVGASGTVTQPFRNVGNIHNDGIDISLTNRLNLTDELRLNATLNFTTYTNEIVKISEGVDYFSEDTRRFTGSNIVRNEVGYPISSYYGYNIIGFWDDQSEINEANSTAQESTGNVNTTYQNEAEVGRFRYEDTNGDGQITPDDRVHLGNPHPNFSAGLNLKFNYRNIDLSMFFYGVQGNELWNQVKWWTDFKGNFNGGKSKTALYDSWTPDNQNASAPIQETTNSFSTGQVPNSYFVEDGSYLRLRNLTLGYTLDQSIIPNIGIRNLRVYFQGTNLLTFTGYSGLDPEISGNTTSYGIDEGIYPNQRGLKMGIDIQF